MPAVFFSKSPPVSTRPMWKRGGSIASFSSGLSVQFAPLDGVPDVTAAQRIARLRPDAGQDNRRAMRGRIGRFLAPDIHFAGLELLFAIVARRKVFVGVLSQGNGGNRSVIIVFDLGDDLERVGQLRHREQPDSDLANEASAVGAAHRVVRSRNTKPGSRLASLCAAANVQEQVGQRFRPHPMPIVFNGYTLKPRSIGLDYDAARIGVISIGNNSRSAEPGCRKYRR